MQRCEQSAAPRDLLVSLVVVVRILGLLDAVLDQFLERGLLANELDQFWNAATSAQHNEPLLLEKQLFDRAAFFLVEKLINFYVASRRG